MIGVLLVMALAADPSAPPLVALPPAPEVVEVPLRPARPVLTVPERRERTRVHALFALTGLGGIAGSLPVIGGGLHLEVGVLFSDWVSLSMGGRFATTVVSRTQLEAGPRVRFQLGEHVSLGAGLALFAVVTPTGRSLGTFMPPWSVSVMGEASSIFYFRKRTVDEVARGGPAVVVSVLSGAPLLEAGGTVNLPFNLVASLSFGWTWR